MKNSEEEKGRQVKFVEREITGELRRVGESLSQV